MDTLVILNILFYLSLSVTLFDLDYTKTKLPEELDIPRWVAFIYLVEIVIWVWILIINWKFAILGVAIYYLSGFIPLPQIVGNFLMSPFKPKQHGKK